MSVATAAIGPDRRRPAMPRRRSTIFDGTKLHALRVERGLTATQLAGLLEALPTSVARWESGEQTPEPSAVRALATVFGVPVIDLTLLERVDDERVGLIELRLLRALTSAEAAAELGVGRKQLSAYENGHRAPSPELTAKLARLYEVTEARVESAIRRTRDRWSAELDAAREQARRPRGAS